MCCNAKQTSSCTSTCTSAHAVSPYLRPSVMPTGCSFPVAPSHTPCVITSPPHHTPSHPCNPSTPADISVLCCLLSCCMHRTPAAFLQALAKYAFGMGSLQVIITTLLFTAVALPAGSGLGTWFLEKVCNAPPSLVSIRTVDEVRQISGRYL